MVPPNPPNGGGEESTARASDEKTRLARAVHASFAAADGGRSPQTPLVMLLRCAPKHHPRGTLSPAPPSPANTVRAESRNTTTPFDTTSAIRYHPEFPYSVTHLLPLDDA